MNSYELDQPLDLRLKALNLSRGFHHELPVQHQFLPAHNLAMVNNLMLNTYGQGGGCGNLLRANFYYDGSAAAPVGQMAPRTLLAESSTSPNVSQPGSILNPLPPFCNQLRAPINNPAPMNPFESNAPGRQTFQQQHQHQAPCSGEPLGAHESAIQGQQQQQQQQANHGSVHCQQPNQQPAHPLNRMHPTPLASHHHQSQAPLSAMSSHSSPLAAPSSNSLLLTESGSSNSSDMLANITPVCHNSPNQLQHHQHHHHHRFNPAPIASSLQNLAHQNSALKQRQLSPPLQHQHHQHHQNQQQQTYQPVMPVRSLSMSGQMLTPSHLSLMVSPTSTPPTSAVQLPTTPHSTSAAGQQHGHPGSESPNSRPSTNFCDTKPNICTSTSTSSIITTTTTNSSGSSNNIESTNNHSNNNSSSKNNSNNNGSSRGSASGSPRLKSPAAGSHNQQRQRQQPATGQLMPSLNGADQSQQRMAGVNQSPSGSPSSNEQSGGEGSNSPIIRQHSLVSRFNCKPCGIVFSQPETLRAHQEGYCTKTNRAQLRSQSAVSPSVIQQAAALSSNPAGK